MPQSAKESLAPKRRSVAGCIPTRMSRSFVGVGSKHLVTTRGVSFKTLSMRRVFSLRQQAVYAVLRC